MATAKANVQASRENEQIVSKVLVSLRETCNHVQTASVMAWEVAAMHLALRRDYRRSDISFRGARKNGETLYAVTADSKPGCRYHVTVYPTRRPECSCMAGAQGKPCKHAGLALGTWAEERETARRAAQAEAGRWAHLSRAEHRELCEIGYRYHTSRERAGR